MKILSFWQYLGFFFSLAAALVCLSFCLFSPSVLPDCIWVAGVVEHLPSLNCNCCHSHLTWHYSHPWLLSPILSALSIWSCFWRVFRQTICIAHDDDRGTLLLLWLTSHLCHGIATALAHIRASCASKVLRLFFVWGQTKWRKGNTNLPHWSCNCCESQV